MHTQRKQKARPVFPATSLPNARTWPIRWKGTVLARFTTIVWAVKSEFVFHGAVVAPLCLRSIQLHWQRCVLANAHVALNTKGPAPPLHSSVHVSADGRQLKIWLSIEQAKHNQWMVNGVIGEARGSNGATCQTSEMSIDKYQECRKYTGRTLPGTGTSSKN